MVQPAPQDAYSAPVPFPSPDIKSASVKVSPVSFFSFVVTSVNVTSVTFKSPLNTPAPVGLSP